jgi:Ca-activated chloride channel family protein
MCFGQTPSTEEVHTVPRTSVGLDSGTDRVPARNLPPFDPQNRPLHVNVDLVLVPVSVSDFMNQPVVTLTKGDFALYEENRPQEIRYFAKEEAPLSVAILLDVSKSMSDKIDIERAAVVEFFKNARPDDEYFAITFSDYPRVVARSTQSIDDLEQRLTTIEPGGPTAMLDAVYLAVSELRSARYKRKAIVIFSDGGDNVSRYTLREVKSLVKESDVQIYAVGLFETVVFNTVEEKLGKKWLSEITDATGGHTLTVDNRAKVPEAAATISRELRNQYVLGFRPVEPVKTEWRKIKVRVTAPPDRRPLRAYYREGYLALH